MEPVKIFLAPCGMSFACNCAVEKNEQGELVLPDFNQCVFTIKGYKAALERALQVIQGVRQKTE